MDRTYYDPRQRPDFAGLRDAVGAGWDATADDPVLGLVHRAAEGLVGGSDAALSLAEAPVGALAGQARTGVDMLGGKNPGTALQDMPGWQAQLTRPPATPLGADVLSRAGQGMEWMTKPLMAGGKYLEDKALSAGHQVPGGDYAMPALLGAIKTGMDVGTPETEGASAVAKEAGAVAKAGEAAKSIEGVAAAAPKARPLGTGVLKAKGSLPIPMMGNPGRAAYEAEALKGSLGLVEDGEELEKRSIPLELIDSSHSMNKGNNPDRTALYARAYKTGNPPYPPLGFFGEGGLVHLVDGNRRLGAAQQSGVGAMDILLRKKAGSTLPALPEEAALQQMLSEGKRGGGFTLEGNNLVTKTKEPRYSVGAFPELGQVLTKDQATPAAVRDYIRRVSKANDDPMPSVGGWVDRDTGNVYLDAVRMFSDEKMAQDLARQKAQKAIYELSKGREIPVDYSSYMAPDQLAATKLRASTRGEPAPMGAMWPLYGEAGQRATEEAVQAGAHMQPKKDGGFIGAPASIRTEADAAARRADNVKMAVQGADYAPWYSTEGGYRKSTNPSGADKVPYTSGIFSNQASPSTELMRDAEQRIALASQGPDKARGTKPNFQGQTDAALAVLQGADPKDVGGLGPKTLDYARTQASPAEWHPTVVDRHEATSRGYDDNAAPGKKSTGFGDSEHSFAKGEGIREAMELRGDPALLAQWNQKSGGAPVLPQTVQAAKWREIKAAKDAASDGVSVDEARRAIMDSPDSSFIKTGELASPSEKLDPNAPWKLGGPIDPMYDSAGILQHPTFDANEARPIWGPESFADRTNSNPGAHSSLSLEDQQKMTRRRGVKGRPFTPEEHLAHGAVDQEQALKDLALVRMFAEGRGEGGLSWRGREMPVSLPPEALASPGSGAGANAVLDALERNPGFERALGPDAFAATKEFPKGRADVMRGRKVLQKGGVAGLKDYVRKNGFKGLLGLVGAAGLNELSSDNNQE